jgi:hypothetical protein
MLAMDPKHLFADERLGCRCVYCGGAPNTRDHVPSKVLLDDPLPDNLPVVQACNRCNNAFSSDEVYFACFLECVLTGATCPADCRRENIKRKLSEKPLLASRVLSSAQNMNGGLVWTPEVDRVRNVVLKLAYGHAAYELSAPQLDEPETIEFVPLSLVSPEQRDDFETAGDGGLQGWPEIGSRAFFRACGAPPFHDQHGPWIVVQPGRYRYSVDEDGGVTVRMVVAEYLACRVVWS